MRPRFLLPFLLSLPISLFAQWQQTNGPEGGQTFALERIGNVIWAGTTGGLFVSNDDGKNWSLSSLLPIRHSVVDIERYGDEVLMLSAGFNLELDAWEYFFHRSDDLGQTWSHLQLEDWSWTLDETSIYRAGDALVYGGNYYFRSFDDGATWEQIMFPDYVSKLAVDGNRMIFTTYFELFLSEDLGETWTFLDSIGTQSAMFLEDSLIMLVTVWDSMQISHDLGASWTSVPMPGNFYGGNFIERGESGKLYIPGWANAVSEDEGLTWSLLDTNILYECFDLEELEGGASQLIAAFDGIHKTTAGNLLAQPATDGLRASNIPFVFATPGGEVFVYSGAGGFRSPNGGLNWFPVKLQEPWSNPGILDVESSGDTLYVNTDYNLHRSVGGGEFTPILPTDTYGGYSITLHEGKIYRPSYHAVLFSSDGGASWDSLNLPASSFGGWDDVFFSNGNMLLINSQGEGFLSIDNAANWTQVLDVWAPGAGNKHRFQKFANRLFVTDNNDFWVSDNDGVTWQSLLPNGLPVIDQGGGWTEPLLPGSLAGEGNLLFASIRNNGVYVSNDLGQNWSPANAGLDNLSTRRLSLNHGVLYVGTNNGGVWRRGGQFESLSGTVYNDLNFNGIKDETEPPMPGVMLKTSPLNSFTTTSADGSFFLYAESFNDTLRTVPPSPYATVEPAFRLAQQASAGNDFAVQFTPNMDDLCIALTNLEPFRPGFDNVLHLAVKNVGTTAQAPVVKLFLPSELAFVASSPTPSEINGDSLTWHLDLMQPFESQQFLVTVLLDQTVQIGNLLTLACQVEPSANDQDPVNNAAYLREEVVGSFDPNDKQVEPAHFTPEHLAAGQPLTYVIRFQNTGTYLAETVRILDTLSTSLDLTTLQVLASSHPCEWSLRNGTLLEFVFENILLPDSTADEPGSHGFVKFSIRPKSHLALGDWVENKADIYFDFNSPVRTNTVKTVVEEASAGREMVLEALPLLVFPNPNAGAFRLVLPEILPVQGRLQVTSAGGQVVFEKTLAAGQKESPVEIGERLATGNYFLHVSAGERSWSGKMVVKK